MIPQIKKMKIDDLIAAEYNPRQLTEEQYKNLSDSIKRFGVVDPIIINKNKNRKNIVIGGHQRINVCRKLKLKEIPCLEIDLTYDEERELNIRLNKNTGEWDFDMLGNMFDISDLKDWGFSEKELKIFNDEEVYTGKIKAPIYEVKNKKPLISEIFDEKKTNNLIEKIEKSSLGDEDKDFLKKASMRHLVFNYSKIADYYAHSDKEMQGLMEKSALVIVDYKKAIENVFVQLSEYLMGLQKDDE